jgi:hypothetical protein
MLIAVFHYSDGAGESRLEGLANPSHILTGQNLQFSLLKENTVRLHYKPATQLRFAK